MTLELYCKKILFCFESSALKGEEKLSSLHQDVSHGFDVFVSVAL